MLLPPAFCDKISDDMLANTFEAFLAALYLDQGIIAATKFCRKQLLKVEKHVNVLGNIEIDNSAKGI